VSRERQLGALRYLAHLVVACHMWWLSRKVSVEVPTDQERTEGELLAAVAAGDGAAFAVFYRRHLPGVVRYLVRETCDREASADLAAEVFAAVFLVARRFRARGGGSAVLWVRGIAQNKLRESRRRGRVEDRAPRTPYPRKPGGLPRPISRLSARPTAGQTLITRRILWAAAMPS
jgi:Sigma-70 region 2